MIEVDLDAIDMMAEEAARVIRDNKRVIREQKKRMKHMHAEILVYKILTVVFMALAIAAAVTLLFA